MANSSSEVIDTTKPTFDLSLRKSTANRLDYLYEISHVPEDSKIPITDFPIVNPYTVFDKPKDLAIPLTSPFWNRHVKSMILKSISQLIVKCGCKCILHLRGSCNLDLYFKSITKMGILQRHVEVR